MGSSIDRIIESQKAALEKSFMKMDQAQSQMQTQSQALLKMLE